MRTALALNDSNREGVDRLAFANGEFHRRPALPDLC